MAETRNPHVGEKQVVDDASLSPAEMRAAIGETRARLATRLARTTDHIHLLFTAPPAQAVARGGGVINGAIKTIAVVGRTTRAWRDARRTGLLRRAAIGAATVAIAVALAAKTIRNKFDPRWRER